MADCCSTCKGTGFIRVRFHGDRTILETCDRCGGTGQPVYFKRD